MKPVKKEKIKKLVKRVEAKVEKKTRSAGEVRRAMYGKDKDKDKD